MLSFSCNNTDNFIFQSRTIRHFNDVLKSQFAEYAALFFPTGQINFTWIDAKYTPLSMRYFTRSVALLSSLKNSKKPIRLKSSIKVICVNIRNYSRFCAYQWVLSQQEQAMIQYILSNRHFQTWLLVYWHSRQAINKGFWLKEAPWWLYSDTGICLNHVYAFDPC